VKKEYLTHTQMDQYYSEVIRGMAISRYAPNKILALSRGGLDFGLKLSHYFDTAIVPITWQLRDHGERDHNRLREELKEAAKYGDSVLVVDDMIDSGATMTEIMDVTDKYEDSVNIDFACAIYNLGSGCDVTWSGRDINRIDEDQWFVFPWENWWK